MKKQFIYILALMSTLTFSCTKVLDQLPQTALDANQAFTTRSGIEAGIIGVYNSLQSGNYYGLRYWALSDMYADNIRHTGTFPSFAQFFNRSLLADNVEITNIWNTIYAGINRANNIIAATPKVNDPSLNKDQILSEARVLRAYFYFDLIRAFGGSPNGYNQPNGLGVPLITKPTLSPADASPNARASEANVYTQILADLDFAINNPGFSNKNTAGRLGKFAAKALKARVQLYRGQWADAEALSTDVIANGGYSLVSTANYATIWLQKNSSESIFELQFDPTNSNAIAFFFYPTSRGGRNEIKGTPDLLNAHEPGDVRKDVNYVSAAPLTGTTLKYTRVSSGDDNVTLIRLAEMYLVRAEARARQGNLLGALADVNVIRARAGLSASLAVTQDQVLAAIAKEKRLELAYEGHRWFELRRTNNTSISLPAGQENRALWPIPQREVQTSNNIITQNPGY